MHRQGRLKWSDEDTSFSFPVFVVWKTSNGVRKGRAVVDIRGLNDIIVPDAYLVPLQEEIINDLRGCDRLFILDAMSFFYQWRVHSADTFKFTVVTHSRGQETFLVPVMGCRNLIAYVQRRMDRLLHESWEFVKAYIDDVIVRSKTFNDHILHLRKVFTLFTAHNVSIKLSKTFLGYIEVDLLGQRVNSIGLSTAKSKLEAISRLLFPSTLGQLETFLGMTGYLRKFVPRYAAVAKPLHDLKTHLLKDAPTKGQIRKGYLSRTKIKDPDAMHIKAFSDLKSTLTKLSILVHFDPSRTLYIDIDASHEFGFGVVLFHDKANGVYPEEKIPKQAGSKWPSISNVQPIMFLSRLLTPAEKNYWPTELETAGLVWTIKKVRHLIELSKQIVMVQTDHSSIVDITQQRLITATASMMRMNVRFIKASQFLSQFLLKIQHKPGHLNVIPDALLRLPSDNAPLLPLDPSFNELDALYIYNTTLVEMDKAFAEKIIKGYEKDPAWRKMAKILADNRRAKML